MRADRVVGRGRRLQLVLLGQRQLRDVRQPARRAGRREPRRAELVAVEGGAVEQVGELPAVASSSSRCCSAQGRDSTSGSSISPRPPRLVGDRLLGLARHQEADRLLLLLGQVREQAGRAGQQGHGLRRRGREAEVEHHGRDRHRDVHRQRPPPRLGDGVAEAARERDVRARNAARVGQLQDPLGAGVERPVHGMSEAGRLAAGATDRQRHVARDGLGRLAGSDATLRLLQPLRAQLGRAEHHRAAAEDARRDGSLERPGVGGERHPRDDVGRHHPVLGDRDEEEVEEVALVVGRLLPREQQVEVRGEAEPAHEVAAEVAAAHLDPVRVGLADVADGCPGLADEHPCDARCCAAGRQAPPTSGRGGRPR